MGALLRLLLPAPVLRPLLKPCTRFLVGAIAIPLFRLFVRRVVRVQELDKELERDLEQWFRGSLLLLVASANMEHLLFDWVPLDLDDRHAWVAVAFRLLLAIGVIEGMPDQALFSVIHPGPKRLRFDRRQAWFGLRDQIKPYLRGMACQHLNRSSPVLAIMTAIFGGNPAVEGEYVHWTVGWVCYGLAITQYLVIGLVTSRDKALDALAEFDRQVAQRREELIEEFDVDPAPVTPIRSGAGDAEVVVQKAG
jgi:hypothetical protein